MVTPFNKEKFWNLVEKSSGCWIWKGYIKNGYGVFNPGSLGPKQAHKLAWEDVRGEVPNGLVLDHLCRTRACVNPEHLEIVTIRENVLRGEGYSALKARQTHCKNGHEFKGGNLVIRKKTGHRSCRKCKQDKDRGRRNELLNELNKTAPEGAESEG